MRLRAVVLAAAMLPGFAMASEFCDTPGAVEELRRTLDEKWKLFKEKRYAEVEAFHSDLVAQHEAGRISDARLARFMNAFNQWEPWVEPLLQEWIRQYPRSYAARYALASHYRAVGWGARGSDFVPKTSDEQFEGMRRAFRKAAAVLDEADRLTRKPTLSDAMRIDMGAASGLAKPGDVYRAAIKAYPQTLEVRIQYIRKSAPKWGGSMGQLRSILDDARSLPPEDQRYMRYLVLQEMGLHMDTVEDFAKATELFKESIPLCPGVDASLKWLVHVQFQHTKDYAGGIVSTSELIRRHPRAGEWYAKRGFAYQELKRYPEAVADFQKGVELAHPHSYFNFGFYYESGTVVPRDPKKAIELYLIADSHKVKGAREKAEQLSRATGIPLR